MLHAVARNAETGEQESADVSVDCRRRRPRRPCRHYAPRTAASSEELRSRRRRPAVAPGAVRVSASADLSALIPGRIPAKARCGRGSSQERRTGQLTLAVRPDAWRLGDQAHRGERTATSPSHRSDWRAAGTASAVEVMLTGKPTTTLWRNGEPGRRGDDGRRRVHRAPVQ